MKIEGSVSFRTILRNVRHGFKTLSYMNWVSASGFQVAGLLGVVGLILAIRDGKVSDLSSLRWFSERASRSEKLQLVPGLQNLGNNCFLNVILQALASCFHFQPFLQKVIEDCQLSMEEEQVASLPLAAALATLLEELCEVGRGYVVWSPRKVMLAMAHYIPNFNLTAQQDAAEAFLHLWSSLREEFSDCYLPNQGSLADVCASSRRILNAKREDQTEQERWQHSFLGPFDGIISSILTCESCSSQISLSFESFHSLPLAPVLSNGTNIMMGCTLEDCLKQFIVAEHVENYCCSHCWHIAGIKYLSSVGANEMEIEKLRRCSEQEDCDCQRLLCLERLPWSNNFSYTLKQLSIARCPKILCIHLKRVAINIFGEPVKLQGHISFPLSMDLLPFMTSGVEIKSWGESLLKKQVTQQCEKTKPFANHLNVQFDTMRLNFIYGLMRENVNSKELDPDESQCSLTVQSVQAESNLGQTEGCSESIPGGHMQSHNSKELDPDESQCSLTVQSVQAESNLGQTEGCSESIPGGHMQSHNSKELDPDESQCSLTVQSVQAESNLGQTEGCSESIPGAMHMQSHYKETAPPESHLYRLVSVVEHLGRAGSGHYTVYRSVRAHSNKDVPDDESEPGSMRWFCVSDSEVHGVSEKEVLDAEATLLFYEKII